jgi:hypothetical protein
MDAETDETAGQGKSDDPCCSDRSLLACVFAIPTMDIIVVPTGVSDEGVSIRHDHEINHHQPNEENIPPALHAGGGFKSADDE